MLVSLRRHPWRWLLVLVLGLSVGLGLAQPAKAFEIVKDELIAADEVIDDDLIISHATSVTVDGTIEGNLIVSSEHVIINGTVEGNLVASGRLVEVNGTVNGTILAAGGRVEVNGLVGGTVFAAGAVIKLGPEAKVTRNVFANGFSFETEAGSTIGRDVATNAYQALLHGAIDRNLVANLGALELAGSVGKDVQLNIDAPDEAPDTFSRSPWFPVDEIVDGGVRVAETAEIGGVFTYTSPVDQASTILAKPAGGVVFTQKVADEDEEEFNAGEFASIMVVNAIGHLLTLLVLGGLTLWRAPQLLPQVSQYAQSKPLPSLGWGVLTFFGGYLGAGLLFVLLILLHFVVEIISFGTFGEIFSGFSFSLWGLGVATLTLLVVFGSKLVIAWLVGQALWQRLAPAQAQKPVGALAIGIVVYVVLSLIPILGTLLAIIVTFIGLGAFWLAFRAARTSPAPTPEPAPIAPPPAA